MKNRVSALFISFVLFQSCSTDFDVIAPYKEVMVIDGLLNAADSIQYVRIAKAFLGEGNAYVMAQQSDSINYKDILDVKMERIQFNQVMETFFLTRSEYNNKDSGIFAYPFHVLYTTNQVIFQDESEYRITVTNRETGTVASSKTKVVKDLLFTSPISPIDSVDWATNNAQPVVIRFKPNAYGNSNAQIFDLIIRFHYRDIDPNGVSTTKSIDWNFIDKTAINNDPQFEMNFSFYKYDFFKTIGLNIPEIPGYTRRTDSLPPGIRPIEIICVEGSEDLQTYIELQQPSSGIVQELPLFTTVENGLGLFSSRIVHPEFRFMEVVMQAAFDTSVSTRNLNFQFD